MSRPQNILNLIPTLKIAYFLPQKAKKKTLKKMKLKARIEGNIGVDLKNILNQNPTPMKAQFRPLFNVKLSEPRLNSTSTQFQLNFD